MCDEHCHWPYDGSFSLFVLYNWEIWGTLSWWPETYVSIHFYMYPWRWLLTLFVRAFTDFSHQPDGWNALERPDDSNFLCVTVSERNGRRFKATENATCDPLISSDNLKPLEDKKWDLLLSAAQLQAHQMMSFASSLAVEFPLIFQQMRGIPFPVRTLK